VVIATPVIVGLSAAGIGQLDHASSSSSRVWSVPQADRVCCGAKPALPARSPDGGFGSVISEVGAAMMWAQHQRPDRVLTTAIVLDVSRGEFGTAIELGGILLALAFLVKGPDVGPTERTATLT